MKIKKLQHFYTTLLLIIACLEVSSQPSGTPYSISKNKIYDVMFQLVDNDNMPSYIGFFSPLVIPMAPRVKGLAKDEGGGFYITEISPNLLYTIGRGRPQAPSARQRKRFSVVYNPMIRMVLSDNSNPILPTNQKAGFRYDYIFRNKHENLYLHCTNEKKDSVKYAFDDNDFYPRKIIKFSSRSLSINFMHFSDGQSDNTPNSVNPKRNNYRSGDFSTNYFNGIYTYSRLDTSSRIFQISGGLQWDWGIPNFVLAYTSSQQGEYGHIRMLANIQFNSKPIKFGKKTYKWIEIINCDTTTRYFKKLVVHKLRFQSEFILDKVSGYRPDLKYSYPFGIHLFYEADFLKSRNIGFFAHIYGGRDYLNIRYDDLIYSLSVGLTLHFYKLFPVYYNDINELKKQYSATRKADKR